MNFTSGATPLAALDAVAVDTETTGLDASRASLVQIGAIGISRGHLQPRDSFESLVDPKIEIPEGSTAIHGITNLMTRGAPSFGEAWARFNAFAAGRVLVGYSIGFDLAILEHEARRAGIPWKRPRTLCVRMLASIANPHLPDQSLEMTAGWLGVSIEGRHQAPGDATAAAGIFIALLPHLAQKGVRTLAEAEQACWRMTSQLEAQHRAGWAEPVIRPEALAGPRAFGPVDPYAYRHRVSDVMSSPPAVVNASATTREVINMMVERKISSAFVSQAGRTGEPTSSYGIVTERDMMRRIAARGEAAFDDPVQTYATRPLASIRGAAFVYRAIGRMDRLRIRHLAVRDEQDRLLGIVSARDLLRLRAGAAISLDDQIDAAMDVAGLAAAWSTLPAVAEALIGEDVEARNVAEIVSEELRTTTRRAAQLSEAEMVSDGRGAPPCPYCLMVLGSGGRGESLLAADQDNAIVFADGVPDGPEDRWFAMLGERIAATLDRAGVPFCSGGVMAKNVAWRGSTPLWLDRISDWVQRSHPHDLLNVDIFFDLRPVWGEFALANSLFDRAFEIGSANPVFAKLLGERVSIGAGPFTLLGGFRTEEGRVDLKKHGLFPLVAFARALAIRHDLRVRSTRERLEALNNLKIASESDFNRLIAAHGTILKTMLAQQSRDLLEGIPVSNRVEVGALSRQDQTELKAALKGLQIIPDLLRSLMFA